MLEALCLCVMGATFHIVRDKMSVHNAIDSFIYAIIAGIAAFSILGEPSTASIEVHFTVVIAYMCVGYFGSEFLEHIFLKWWESE